jgi:hypothetical protein
MITLSVLKGASVSGPIKKMVHAPTLKLYIIKEIPQANRDIRKALKDWIAVWQASLNQCSKLI